MNVLSLFDGIACGRLALKNAGINVAHYYASEIAPNAIKVAQHNFPDIIQLGDINNFKLWNLPKIDLIIGGSPCQDFSTLNNIRLGLQGPKSNLFYKFIECLNYFKPKYFLLENNANMPKSAKKIITELLNVQPILLNSALVSAQMRKRLYWTNIPNIAPPTDLNIKFEDIYNLDNCNEIKLCNWANKKLKQIILKYNKIPHFFSLYNVSEITDKHYCLTTHGTQVHSSAVIIYENNKFYLPDATIWEKLQNLPVDYTAILKTENARKYVIGNAWTINIITHIFKNIPYKEIKNGNENINP